MFLKLNRQKPGSYSYSYAFVLECYTLSKQLPEYEKFGLVSHLRRASLSVHLNIAGCTSGKSEIERKGFYEISWGSIVETDAIPDTANGFK
jgi:four helix bundle protein